MSGKRGLSFHDLEIYKRYELLSDLLWTEVEKWDFRHQKTIGDQLLRAVDSIGANIAESVGRYHSKDSQNFLFYARGSLTETQHWIRVAVRRKLLQDSQVIELRQTSLILIKQINAFIRTIKVKRSRTTNSQQPTSNIQEVHA